jgi:hypothetical protein
MYLSHLYVYMNTYLWTLNTRVFLYTTIQLRACKTIRDLCLWYCDACVYVLYILCIHTCMHVSPCQFRLSGLEVSSNTCPYCLYVCTRSWFLHNNTDQHSLYVCTRSRSSHKNTHEYILCVCTRSRSSHKNTDQHYLYVCTCSRSSHKVPPLPVCFTHEFTKLQPYIHQYIHMHTGHRESVTGVSLSAGGLPLMIASCSLDGTVRMWVPETVDNSNRKIWTCGQILGNGHRRTRGEACVCLSIDAREVKRVCVWA